MRHLLTLPVLSLAFASVSTLSATAATLFQSTLNGAQEVPPVTTTGMGNATLMLTGDPGSYVLNYTVNYFDLMSEIASPFAHIHNGALGMNGPVVHDLDGANMEPIEGSTFGTIVGNWSFADASPFTNELAQALMDGNLYFNIHTEDFRGGEIRGQIEPSQTEAVPEPTSLMGLALLGGAGLLSLQSKSRK